MWHARITLRNHFNNRLNFLRIFSSHFSSFLKTLATWPKVRSRNESLFHDSRKKTKEKKENSMALIGERSSHSFAFSIVHWPALGSRNWFDICTMAHTKFISLNYTITMDVQCGTHIDLHVHMYIRTPVIVISTY